MALCKGTLDPAARHRFTAGLFWGLTYIAAIACVAVAQATTVKRMTFSEVIRAAEVIVAGEVVSIDDSVWDAEWGMPYTEVVFFVNRSLKGEVGVGQELRLRFEGWDRAQWPDSHGLRHAHVPAAPAGRSRPAERASGGPARWWVGGRVFTGSVWAVTASRSRTPPGARSWAWTTSTDSGWRDWRMWARRVRQR